jgi:multidrug efflux pump subunit AcrA (membrane-fusion protein)
MQVKAKVNESKVSFIQTGQRAKVVVDAFPNRPMEGTVAEITPIPAPSNGPMSDVRVYYAVVKLDDGGFSELRPGLSAEVTFRVDNKRQVTRVPLGAVRWFNEKPYVAIGAKPAADGGLDGNWRPIELGGGNLRFFEVVAGLKPGDKVIADPTALRPPPAMAPPREKAFATATPARG